MGRARVVGRAGRGSRGSSVGRVAVAASDGRRPSYWAMTTHSSSQITSRCHSWYMLNWRRKSASFMYL
jgi:hypothetical protein